MFKVFTVISLLALLGGGEKAEPASPWLAIAMVALLIAVICISLVWLRKRFRIVRRHVRETFTRKATSDQVMSNKTWESITSGEMAKRLMKRDQ